MTVRFNLSTQSWLPVVDFTGRQHHVSLRELFTNAHELRRIAGDTPPMTAALHRFVLALAHRIYGPASDAAWAELWAGKELPGEQVEEYLSAQHSRFELFDAERPFFQCPGVRDVPPTSAAKLVPHRASGNNATLFDHTVHDKEVLLSPAEAARWLITLQAYDPGGTKTPYRKEKSSQAAPGNWFGMVLVEGANLKETLLLNLMRYHPEGELPRMTTVADRPVWEADPPGPEPDERRPLGWTDLLTWPSRRVWLHPREVGDRIVVDRVVITPGTRLKAEAEDAEWMSAYQRFEKKKGKKSGKDGKKRSLSPWYPIRLQSPQGVWRHARQLLLAPSGSDELLHQRPLTLDHVGDMVANEYVPEDAVYTLRVFGQQLDKNYAVVHQVLEEAVAAPVALLRARVELAGPVIGHSVELADQVGAALTQMERDHRMAFHAEPSTTLDLAYWPQLAQPFDAFLLALPRQLAAAAPGSRPDESATDRWAEAVQRIAEQAARSWAEGSPRQGRSLEAVGEYYGRFMGELRQALAAYQGHLAGYLD